MKIYTRTGDSGETGLFAGGRVPKDDARIEAYGTIDEFNAALGLVRCERLPPEVEQTLERVQNELFAVGAELATPDAERHRLALISEQHTALLERDIDNLEAGLPPLKNFILPAGSRAACLLHLARGICRRGERRIVALAAAPTTPVSSRLLTYINRLSDYLFVAARFVNVQSHTEETIWRMPRTPAAQREIP
jgi:cob(I)alamin adenosyltransferase